jgi:hypothetical protein
LEVGGGHKLIHGGQGRMIKSQSTLTEFRVIQNDPQGWEESFMQQFFNCRLFALKNMILT